MSHIVTIKTKILDPTALAAACRRLGLGHPVQETVTLFEGEASGLVVRLPGWTYPVVVNTATGETKYDNFNGHWGRQLELDRLMQAYAVEKARIEARRAGHDVQEQQLADGSIKVTIAVGGAA